MASGLVYLRPKRVVYCRAFGPFRKSSQDAWRAMFDWIDRIDIRDEVVCGYGLARYSPDKVEDRQRRYEACIEMPPSLNASDLQGVKMQELPGGAYVRRRHVGPIDGLGDAIRELRDEFVAGHGLRIDPRRPLVEVFFDDPKTADKENTRVDLCLPIATD